MFVRLSAALAAIAILTGPAGAEGAKLSDPQIAHIAYTAGVLDVAAAKQALLKSNSEEVKQFAADMVRHHEAREQAGARPRQEAQCHAAGQRHQQGAVEAGRRKYEQLAKLNGAAYDKGYIDNEIAYHKQVNGALETQLIPSASNAELKGLLQTGLKIFQGHQQHAEHVAADLKGE
jgi:putative membrane protein